jgi:glucose/arabinose dehydrogenase
MTKHRATRPLAVALLLPVFLGLAALDARATVPFGFSDELIAGGFNIPVGVRFDHLGRALLWEKGGRVLIVEANGTVLPTPLIDLTDEVHGQHDRGLLGVALDPAYANNGYIYFLYNVDPIFGEPDENPDSATWSRLTRYTVVGNQADPASRLVLLGNGPSDGIPSCHNSHSIGTLVFGHDGSLFVSSGDGAHYDFTDGGQNVTIYDPECAATFGSAADNGALRSQTYETLAGKILRIDPATGLGYTDNPWYDGDLSTVASRAWAIGLRNPYRINLRPLQPLETGPGTLFIGDVGWNAWEELNVAVGGENFGWPCYEGVGTQGSYQGSQYTSAFCQALGSGAVDPPLITWHHSNPGSIGFVGNCAAGVAFYTGNSFPASYNGKCFFVDYGDSWIRVADVDANNQLLSQEGFATGLAQPVDLKVDPNTGDLVYVSVTQGWLRRIHNVLTPAPPVAVASATPSSGPLPLDVQFSSDGSFDPNGDPFTVEWDFGDGSPTSFAPNPMHQYTTLATFDAWLMLTDDGGLSDSTMVTVQTINLPPTVAITSPANLYEFGIDEVIALTATASDPEDGTNLNWQWQIDLIHNDHPHPNWITTTEENSSFVAEAHGETGDRFSYRVRVIVTDTGNEAASDTTWIKPQGQVANNAPIPAFVVDSYQGQVPLVVQFDATSSVDPDDDLMIMDWNFGDGTGGSGVTTSHIFGAPGLYTVTLSAHDPGLAVGVTQATILAEPAGGLANWPLDEDGGFTAFDQSSSGYDGSLGGGTLWTSGVKGTALDFNGTDAWVGTGQSFLSGRPAFAISAWVYPRSTGNRVGLVGQNDAIEFGFISTAQLQVWTSSGGSVGTPWPFPMDEWHHAVVQGNGTELTIWVDGTLANTTLQSTGSYGNSGFPVNFGGGGVWDATGNWFNGLLDEVRIYDRALTQAEIALLSTAPPVNSSSSPNAGLDGDGIIGTPFALLGLVTDDGNPSPPGKTTVLWSQSSGPPTASIFSPTTLFTWVDFIEPGNYVFQLEANDGEQIGVDAISIDVLFPTGAPSPDETIVSGLHGVSPNPVLGYATISYGVTRDGAPVQIAVYGVDGRRVALLYDGAAKLGKHELNWTTRDANNTTVASGVYFLIADVDGRRTTRKMTVIR